MAPVLNEGRHATEGLLSEADFGYSRDVITVASGSGKIEPGTILGKVTASGKYKPSINSAADPATGEEVGSVIALYACDATSADAKVVAITRAAQWKIGDLIYHSSVDSDTKKAAKRAQLAAVGIVAR